MARELRREGDKLNFLGGKRCIKNCTASSVAIAKLRSETGQTLQARTLHGMQQGSLSFVHWGAKSKYALFVGELTDSIDLCVDIRSAGVPGAKRLEWVSRAELKR